MSPVSLRVLVCNYYRYLILTNDDYTGWVFGGASKPVSLQNVDKKACQNCFAMAKYNCNEASVVWRNPIFSAVDFLK
jgi:hypothetical protein